MLRQGGARSGGMCHHLHLRLNDDDNPKAADQRNKILTTKQDTWTLCSQLVIVSSVPFQRLQEDPAPQTIP